MFDTVLNITGKTLWTHNYKLLLLSFYFFGRNSSQSTCPEGFYSFIVIVLIRQGFLINLLKLDDLLQHSSFNEI